MTAKCRAEGGKIVEAKEGKCLSCGRPIFYKQAMKVKEVVK